MREKTVAGLPVSWAVTCPVIPVEGMDAGTLLIMAPVGMVTAAVSVARVPTVQLLISIVSGAPTLSVSTTVTAAEQLKVPNVPTVNDTGGPAYVLLEEWLLTELLDGAAVWLMLVVAVTCAPANLKGSVPLWRLKVPVTV